MCSGPRGRTRTITTRSHIYAPRFQLRNRFPSATLHTRISAYAGHFFYAWRLKLFLRACSWQARSSLDEILIFD